MWSLQFEVQLGKRALAGTCTWLLDADKQNKLEAVLFFSIWNYMKAQKMSAKLLR